MNTGIHKVEFDFFRGYGVADARNKIAQATLDRGFDYVLMLDSDEVLPKDALINLLEDEENEESPGMVVGYCFSRSGKSAKRTTAFKWGGVDYTPEDAYTTEELKSLRDNCRYKVQIRGSGLACALIHRSVFERMPYPWFRWVHYENKTQLSEDLYFCEKFRLIATPIFLDTRVACGHMMRHIEWP